MSRLERHKDIPVFARALYVHQVAVRAFKVLLESSKPQCALIKAALPVLYQQGVQPLLKTRTKFRGVICKQLRKQLRHEAGFLHCFRVR
ncbi:hypothetical protein WI73_24585 [Burkholderia ubonensis]|nr:hypothetical protein WI73_24585 [Burkholderia ubonensis]